MARIVVGIDGSKHSKEALRWALAEARLRAASLRVVLVWKIPTYFVEGLAPVEAIPDPVALNEAARKRLDSIVHEITGGSTEVPIEQLAVEGAAAEILVEESKGADMLVVGSRGHGGFAGLLLGSVSQQCAHHAACPVVVMRARVA